MTQALDFHNHHDVFNNTTASGNTADGTQALQSNTTGADNTASGAGALYSNTPGPAAPSHVTFQSPKREQMVTGGLLTVDIGSKLLSVAENGIRGCVYLAELPGG